MPEEILAFPQREPSWGPRVRVLDVSVESGVATVNLSREFHAVGGRPERLKVIREQIVRTLFQFPEIQGVELQVEGEPVVMPLE